MSVAITYNNTTLQDANIISKRAAHIPMPQKEFSLFRRSMRDDIDITDQYYTQKIIVVEGVIKDTSRANLVSRIDTLKKNLESEVIRYDSGYTYDHGFLYDTAKKINNFKPLDIDWGAGTRRYYALIQKMEIDEQFYNITHVPYMIEFLTRPFGKGTTLLTDSNTAKTTSPFSKTISFSGSIDPQPVWYIKLNSVNTISAVKFENLTTSQSVTITRTYAASDVIEINSRRGKVYVNATEVDFTGVIPKFIPGSNKYQVTVTGTSFNADVLLEYFDLYT